jgi:dTDP-4-amino-4,6-dideoxygalactose transaminase
VRYQATEEVGASREGRLFDRPLSTSSLVPPDRAFLRAYVDMLFEPDGEIMLVRLMERRFAEFHDVPYCVAHANGFWSLVSCIRACAIPGRSEIVMPSLTYRRMADVAAWAGLKPRFCEVDETTLAATPSTVDACLSDRTALILGVHPIVGVCDAAGLADLGRRRKVPVLFDAVESAFETLPEGRVGRFGEAEVFSLHASKLINGFEGGYATTLRPDLARHLMEIRDHGTAGNWGRGPGLNARLSGLHAAAALASLDGLEKQVEHNRSIYDAYSKHLRGIPGIRLVPFRGASRTSFKNIVAELDLAQWPLSRDETVRRLNEQGALARAYYAPALHQRPMAYPHVPASLPVTEALAERFVLLPCGYHVTQTDVLLLARFLAELSSGARISARRDAPSRGNAA